MNKRIRQNKLSENEKLVKRIYNSKKGLKKVIYEKFQSWYKNQDYSCAYCGLRSQESIALFRMFPNSTRGGRRGK